MGDEVHERPIKGENSRKSGITQNRGLFSDRVKQKREIRARRAEQPKHCRSRFLMLLRFVQLAPQPTQFRRRVGRTRTRNALHRQVPARLLDSVSLFRRGPVDQKKHGSASATLVLKADGPLTGRKLTVCFSEANSRSRHPRAENADPTLAACAPVAEAESACQTAKFGSLPDYDLEGGMESVRVERRLAAIMAVDIVGYSRLIESDERGTLAGIKALRSDVIDPLLAEHKGRLVKLMGDGALVEFTSVVDAVACAVAVQAGVAAHEAKVPPHRRIVFRIGINLGDVVVEGDDLLGDGVMWRRAWSSFARRGRAYLRHRLRPHEGQLGLPIDFTGEQQVKNISERVRTYSVRTDGVKPDWRLRGHRFRGPVRWAAVLLPVVLIAGAAAWWFRPVDTAVVKPTIAVLPFDNLTGDDPTSRLADGITEDIITDFARFPEFDVVARTLPKSTKTKPLMCVRSERIWAWGLFWKDPYSARATNPPYCPAHRYPRWQARVVRALGQTAADLFAVQTEIAEQLPIAWEAEPA
jgi:class 3 adenylate cyclase